MNKWEAAVVIVALLVLGFIYEAAANPTALSQYTGFGVEIALAIFGIAAVAIVVNFFYKSKR